MARWCSFVFSFFLSLSLVPPPFIHMFLIPIGKIFKVSSIFLGPGHLSRFSLFTPVCF